MFPSILKYEQLLSVNQQNILGGSTLLFQSEIQTNKAPYLVMITQYKIRMINLSSKC